LRNKGLILWYSLLVLIILETFVWFIAVGMSGYYRRCARSHFNTFAAVPREIDNVPFASIINKYASQERLNGALVAAVIKAESSFNPRALSKTGAVGLMQIMPATWRQVNSDIKACAGRHSGDCGAECYYNPELNIYVGTVYISQMIKRYNGDLVLALAAYNAGPGAVDTSGEVPSYSETEEYVEMVIAYWYGLADTPVPIYGQWAVRCEQVKRISTWLVVGTLLIVVAVARRLVVIYGSWRWR